MREIKFIIVKDKLGRLRHFVSDWKHHSTIARDNGYDVKEIIEAGIFLDRRKFIVECEDKRHLLRRKDDYVGNCVYQEIRLQSWLKGRELESQLYYSKSAIGLKDGD